jgi:hypothetical protein
VTDPEGKAWTVRRRWFPWRRALSVRSIWHSTPDSDKPDDDATPANEGAESKSSGNPVLNAILTIVGLLLWLVVTAGKAVLILLAAVVVITLSLADLILQLLVMPRRPVDADSARGADRRADQVVAHSLSATQGDAEPAIDHASSAGTSITR